jgi:hypothetical protein
VRTDVLYLISVKLEEVLHPVAVPLTRRERFTCLAALLCLSPKPPVERVDSSHGIDMLSSDLPAVYAAVVLHQGSQLGHDPNANVFPWTHERAMLSVNESISVHQSDTHEAASPRPNPSSRKWVPHYEKWRGRALVHRSEGFHCQHTIRESGGRQNRHLPSWISEVHLACFA